MSMTEDASKPSVSPASAAPAAPLGPTPAPESEAGSEARAMQAAERLAKKLAEAGQALGAAAAKGAEPAAQKASASSSLAPPALLKAAPAAPPSGPAAPVPPPAPNVARMSAPYEWEGKALEDDGATSQVIPPTESKAKAVAAAASSQILEKVKGGWLRAAEARPPRRWKLIGGGILGLGLLAFGAGVLLKDRDPASFSLQTDEIRARMAQRPELAIHTLRVTGRETLSVEEIRTALGLGPDGKVSAMGFDAAAVRQRLMASPWVREATVALSDSGEVAVTLEERRAAAVWQVGGEFWLIDTEGARIARVMDATERLDLPWIVGAGADRAAGEAWRLLESAGPELRAQIGALTRVGGRRWDIELVDGRRILLPETDPMSAARALGELTRGSDLLQRSFLELNYTNAAEGLVASLPDEAQAYRERLRVESAQPRR